MDGNDRRLTAFTMLGHAMFHTYELAIPIFVAIWLTEFGVSTEVLGVVVGVSYALTGLGALPSGVLADRYSSRWLIVASMGGMGAGFLLTSVAPGLSVVAVGLLLWGAAAGIYHPAGLALISRGAKSRGTAFAYHGLAGNVGVATGPLLAAVLLIFFEWRAVAALLVVPVVVAVALAVRLDFDEAAGTREREGDAGPDRTVEDLRSLRTNTRALFTVGFGLVFLVGNLYGLYYRGAFTFLPEVLAALPVFEPTEFGGREFAPSQYVYSGLLLLGGLGQYVGGRLVDRVRAEYALVGTFSILVLIALAFVPAAEAGLVPLLVVSALLGFFVFMEAPINQEVISRHVDPDLRGLSFGYTYAAIFGVGALGATVAGFVLARWSTTVLFAILAGFAVLAVALGLALVRLGEAE